jgi:hypothetical protein
MAKPISEELQADIHIIRESALQLRDEMSSPTLKARIDLALRDLDEIPRLFDSEVYMRQALIVPQARIKEVVQIRDTYGQNAEAIPGDITGGGPVTLEQVMANAKAMGVEEQATAHMACQESCRHGLYASTAELSRLPTLGTNIPTGSWRYCGSCWTIFGTDGRPIGTVEVDD